VPSTHGRTVAVGGRGDRTGRPAAHCAPGATRPLTPMRNRPPAATPATIP